MVSAIQCRDTHGDSNEQHPINDQIKTMHPPRKYILSVLFFMLIKSYMTMPSKNAEAPGRNRKELQHPKCQAFLRASHTKSIDDIVNEINNTISTKKLTPRLKANLCQLSGDQFTSEIQVKQLAQSISAQRGLLEKEKDFKYIDEQLLRILTEISESKDSKTTEYARIAAEEAITQWVNMNNYEYLTLS